MSEKVCVCVMYVCMCVERMTRAEKVLRSVRLQPLQVYESTPVAPWLYKCHSTGSRILLSAEPKCAVEGIGTCSTRHSAAFGQILFTYSTPVALMRAAFHDDLLNAI